MLTGQLGVSIADAFAWLRAYAYVNDLQMADVARDIVARRLRLFPTLTCPEVTRREALAGACGTPLRSAQRALLIS